MYYIFHRAAKKPSISASVSVSVCPRWEAGRVSGPLMGSGPREPVLGSSANQQVLRTEALIYERLGKRLGGGIHCQVRLLKDTEGARRIYQLLCFGVEGGGTTPAPLLSQSKINSS